MCDVSSRVKCDKKYDMHVKVKLLRIAMHCGVWIGESFDNAFTCSVHDIKCTCSTFIQPAPRELLHTAIVLRKLAELSTRNKLALVLRCKIHVEASLRHGAVRIFTSKCKVLLHTSIKYGMSTFDGKFLEGRCATMLCTACWRIRCSKIAQMFFDKRLLHPRSHLADSDPVGAWAESGRVGAILALGFGSFWAFASWLSVIALASWLRAPRDVTL